MPPGQDTGFATDGPFAAAKEFLAGFLLIDAPSLERALEIAARVPEADLGLVEVRPTMDLSTFDRQRRQSGREVGDPSGARQLRCDVARSRR